jgi:AbiV family abortive infection protein
MKNSSAIRNLNKAIPKVLDNANRLVDDAQYLLEYGRPPSAFALCILAQEEYAKAFLLYLISTGALQWSQDIRRLLRDHICKQLIASIIDFLQPEDLISWHENRSKEKYRLPDRIVDAINIIRHEKARKAPRLSWVGDNGPPCDREARKIADGDIDKEKQDAIYIKIGKNGDVVSTPERITEAMAKELFEKTKRLGFLSVSPEGKLIPISASLDCERISLIFRFLFGQCTAEEFSKLW